MLHSCERVAVICGRSSKLHTASKRCENGRLHRRRRHTTTTTTTTTYLVYSTVNKGGVVVKVLRY